MAASKVFNLFKNFFNSSLKDVFDLKTDNSLASITNIGIERTRNEDFTTSGINKFNNKILILADGLGGYLGGKECSEIVCKTIIEAFADFNFKNKSSSSIQTWFITIVNEARSKISNYIKKHPEYQLMSTTLNLIIINSKKAYAFNIGDSRIYGITNKKLKQISQDHNYLNFLLKEKISEKEILKYGAKVYAITNFVGEFDEMEIKYDFFEINLKDYDYLFLTSDGVHNFVTEEMFLNIFQENISLYQKAYAIIEKAIELQSNDNLSISIVNMKY